MATKKTTKTATEKAVAKPVATKKPAAAKKTATVAKAEKPAKTCACACEAKAPAKKACSKKAAAEEKASRVKFAVRAEVGSKVFLAGSFNNWDPTAKEMADKNGTGEFTCCLNLTKGSYEYKFVINGTWCADPECTDWVQNDMGTLNSLKIVG